jgi:hypothetical protein
MLKWLAQHYVDNGAYCLKHKINVGGAKEPLPQVRVFKRKAKLQ